jgi:hypothetical protein
VGYALAQAAQVQDEDGAVGEEGADRDNDVKVGLADAEVVRLGHDADPGYKVQCLRGEQKSFVHIGGNKVGGLLQVGPA